MIDLDDMTNPDDAIDALRADSGADSQIVVRLLRDLRGRCGFDNEWDALDEEIQLEIILEWTGIVRAVFARGGAE